MGIDPKIGPEETINQDRENNHYQFSTESGGL